MSNSTEIDVLILGSGVIGLACAERISRENPGLSIAVADRHPKFGQEISSHNSEVIHAGIYYKSSPLKNGTCAKGNALLYRFCLENDIPHSNCGKFVLAFEQAQMQNLEQIRESAASCGVNLKPLGAEEIRLKLPGTPAIAALWSATTGIVDSHLFMQKLEALAASRDVVFLYDHSFEKVEQLTPQGTEVVLVDRGGLATRVFARVLVNATGLAAARVASAFNLDSRFEIRACRGRYFSLSSRWNGKYQQLLYPVPDPRGGLGVHLTFDLSGKCRLGPDVDWEGGAAMQPDDPEQYRFTQRDSDTRQAFFEAGKKLLPDLRLEDLSADYVGVRPKLFVDGAANTDFLIYQGRANDLHLLGIESPGLTSSLALADEVFKRLKNVF